MVLGVRLLEVVVVLGRLAEEFCEGRDGLGSCRRRLPLTAGKPVGHFLEQPAVAVRILKRSEREVAATLRVAPADARVLVSQILK